MAFTTRTPYVFMVLEDHPYGREMLRALLGASLVPLAVIEERSAVAEQEAAKFNARMAGLELAPGFDALLASSASVAWATSCCAGRPRGCRRR